ncbi:MAG: SEL1-like repeat protein [Succinivibrionaceae bacterium]
MWKKFWLRFSYKFSKWLALLNKQNKEFLRSSKGRYRLFMIIVGLIIVFVGIVICQYYFKIQTYRSKAHISWQGKFYKESLENFELLAQLGDDEGLYKTAEMYLNGLGTKKDQRKATEYLTKAAEKGNKEAQTKLGELYYSSSYLTRTCLGHDYKKALYWFRKAGNDPKALEAIATMYQYGLGVPQDLVIAQNYYDKWIDVYYKKAQQGDAKSQYLLGLYFYDGTRHQIDEEKAKEWFEKSANQNYIPALEILGNLYTFGGEKIQQDTAKANDIYKKLIELYTDQIGKNDIDAMIQLSTLYSNGIGVPQDLEKAKKFLILASNNNSFQAKEILADLLNSGSISFEDGTTSKQLKKEARELKEQAALNGDIPMMRQLGYESVTNSLIAKAEAEGTVPIDRIAEIYIEEQARPYVVDAIKWFTNASEAGDAVAMMDLGHLYYTATDLTIRSINMSEVWLKKSAELCYEPAYVELGELYSIPKTSLHNLKLAIEWYKKAAEQGNIEAQLKLAKTLAKGGKGVQPNYKEGLVWLKVVQLGYEKNKMLESQEYKDLLLLEDSFAHYLSEEEQEQVIKEAKEKVLIFGSNW